MPVREAARVQAVTCLAQLAQPHKAWEIPGRDSDHHSPAVTQATPTPTPKLLVLEFPLFVPDDGNVFSILYLGRNGSDTCSDTLHVSLRPAVIPSASIHAPVKCVPAAAG